MLEMQATAQAWAATSAGLSEQMNTLLDPIQLRPCASQASQVSLDYDVIRVRATDETCRRQSFPSEVGHNGTGSEGDVNT